MLNNNNIKEDFEERFFMLKKILFDIYSDPKIANNLIFKWWTSLILFYWLERFSEDLDFNVIEEDKIEYIAKEVYKNLKLKWYEMEEFHDWDNVYAIDVLYNIGDNKYSCKVEFFKTNYWVKQDFNIFPLFHNWKNINIKVLDMELNYAHKGCAYLSRWNKDLSNSWRPKWRDLFDINFYIDMNISPNIEIIKKREGFTTIKDFYKGIYKYFLLKHRTKKHITTFVEELENFSYNKINWLEFLNQLLKKIELKAFWKTINFQYNYKDLLEEGKKMVLLSDKYLIVKDTWDYFAINDVDTNQVLLKSNKINKIDSFIREEIIAKM